MRRVYRNDGAEPTRLGQARSIWSVWFVWFVWLVGWLHETNQIDQIDQIDGIDQMNKTGLPALFMNLLLQARIRGCDA